MMTIYLLGAAGEVPIIATDTAILILLVVGVLWLAKSVLGLRSEVEALKRESKPSIPQAAAPAITLASPVPVASVAQEIQKSSVGGVPPNVRAAIAAAIYATQGSRSRIVSISPETSMIWSREGRRQVFESHRVR